MTEQRIAELIKNAYDAGRNDGWDNRDELAKSEIKEAYMEGYSDGANRGLRGYPKDSAEGYIEFQEAK